MAKGTVVSWQIVGRMIVRQAEKSGAKGKHRKQNEAQAQRGGLKPTRGRLAPGSWTVKVHREEN